MENKGTPIVGVLVLAGLLDTVGDMGTQGHYDLLPIPWAKNELKKRVTHTLKVDIDIRSRLECHETVFAKDDGELQALSRGIGVRVWITGRDQKPKIMKLLTLGFSRNRFKAAATELDHLSFHVSPFIFPWSNDINDNDLMTTLHNICLLYSEVIV
jgi:hypothetical protein